MAVTSARYYSAFGLTVRSEIELPELPRTDHQVSDDVNVVIRWGSIDPPRETDDTAIDYSGPDEYYLLYQVATIRIRDGREIVVDPRDDPPHEVLRHVVLGPALNYLLHQRGHFVLHASTVEIEGRAVAFLGESGQGKTTTAMAFLLEGFPVLSDDVATIEFGPDGPRVQSGYPAIKLDPAVVERFDIPVEKPRRTSASRDRHFHGLPYEQPATPVPLERVYVLEDGDALDIVHPPPREQLMELVEHTYTRGLLDDDKTAVSNFRRCTMLAEEVTVKRLQRPRTFETLPGLVERVCEDVGGVPGPTDRRPGEEDGQRGNLDRESC